MHIKSYAVLTLAVFLSGCGQTVSGSAEKDAPPAAYSLTENDIKTVEASIRSNLKNSNSATIGQVTATRRTDGVITVCGYVGTTPFMGQLVRSLKPSFYLAGVGNDKTNAAATMTFCRKAGIDI